MIQKKTRELPPANRPPRKPADQIASTNGSCPYLDCDDSRCASRFSLDRIDQMFEVCLGPGMAGCFVYHRLQKERTRQSSDQAAPRTTRMVSPTHEGQLLQF